MMMIVLLVLAVALYFVTTDRRYVLAVLVAVAIEALTLSLMGLFKLPSMMGYLLGMLILVIALVSLLLREDHKVQRQLKPSPMYIEHTPVYEESEQCDASKDFKTTSS